MKNKSLFPFLLTVFLAFASIIVTSLTGCSGDGEFVAASPEPDAGLDSSKPDSGDASKEAASPDANPDASVDASAEANADASQDTSASTDAGEDAGPEATVLPDGSVALNPGDLIKGSDQATYYYGNDLKRHLFPNEKTFLSWFTTAEMSIVKTIPDAQMALIAEGSHVTVRPGTWLVKITSDPKTYAITDCGALHWIESEAIMAALYGADWNTRIIDVPDQFFADYQTGASITSSVHPDGTLIAYANDPNRYVVMNGQKRKIATQAAFEANHWQSYFVLTTVLPYGDGPDVTSSEPQNFWQIGCTP